MLHLHALKEKLDAMLAREGRTELAAACFRFLPDRVRLDLAGWADEDIFLAFAVSYCFGNAVYSRAAVGSAAAGAIFARHLALGATATRFPTRPERFGAQRLASA